MNLSISKKTYILFFVFSIILSFSINTINKKSIEVENVENIQSNTKSILYGGTIYSIDNDWYLPQAENILEGNGYIIDIENESTRYRRTPGYSLWYLAHRFFLSKESTHLYIFWSQLLIYAMSVVGLLWSMFFLTKDKLSSIMIALVYLCMPCTVGYLNFTITEAIHPSFTILAFSMLIYAFAKDRLVYYFTVGVLIAYVAFIRPSNGILLVALGFAYLIYYQWNFKKIIFYLRGSMIVLGFLTLIAPWTYRNYELTNEFIPLERIENNDPMGMGKIQYHLSKWWMCWGNPRQEQLIHSIRDGISNDTYVAVDQFINTAPEEAFLGSSKEQVRNILYAYQDCYAQRLQKNTKMGEVIACEYDVSDQLDKLIANYKEEAFFRYYIYTPWVVRGKEFIFQSFSSMYGSLNPVSKDFSIVQIIVKALMYLFNLSLYAGFLYFLVFGRKDALWTSIVIMVLGTFTLMIYYVHIEARYMLVAYPFMVISLVLSINHFIRYMLSFFQKKRDKIEATVFV